MRNSPKISIIVPVYKVEYYLKECVSSILSQTYTDFELLLIDDGSPDRSGDICDEYARIDNRVKVFHKKNQGVSSARNLGIEKAIGKWICFIDSDDLIEESYIESFFQYGEPEDDCLVLQGLKYIDRKTRRELKKVSYKMQYMNANELSNRKDLYLNYRFLHEGGPYLKLFNNNIIKANNLTFNTEISLHEDRIFYFQYLLNVEKILFTENVKYHYFQNPGSLVHSIHDYYSLEKAYRKLRVQLENVISHFSFIDECYCRDIRSFLCIIHVRAIASSYILLLPRKERISILRSNLSDDFFKNYYKAISLKTKVIKLILTFPIFLQDSLLYVLSIGKRKKRIKYEESSIFTS